MLLGMELYMKKISLGLLISFVLVSCGIYKYLDLGMLTTGMTIEEVENMAGPPQRVLAVNKKDGYTQEVLEYRTSRNEVYALEFWDNYLTGYEYLYDEATYIPPPMPPAVFPPYGRPIYIYPPERPNRPGRPESNRPDRPNRPSRPESNRPNRPESNRPESVRPESSRPNRPSNSGTGNRADRYTNPNNQSNTENKTNDRKR